MLITLENKYAITNESLFLFKIMCQLSLASMRVEGGGVGVVVCKWLLDSLNSDIGICLKRFGIFNLNTGPDLVLAQYSCVWKEKGERKE